MFKKIIVIWGVCELLYKLYELDTRIRRLEISTAKMIYLIFPETLSEEIKKKLEIYIDPRPRIVNQQEEKSR